MSHVNQWIGRSIRLATHSDYLDQLHDVYPVNRPKFRKINPTLRRRLGAAHKRQDSEEFFVTAMDLPVFPYEEPYMGFFRHSRNAFRRNPATVERISGWLLTQRFEQIIAMAGRPKRAVKQFGQAFRRWWFSLDYPKIEDSDFGSMAPRPREIIVHGGTPKQWKRFANSELDCGLVKEPDLLARKGRHYIIGEAKFITAFGGGQDDKLDEVLDFVRNPQGNAHRIAVVDGPLWLNTQNYQSITIRNLQADALSALLLPDFLGDF